MYHNDLSRYQPYQSNPYRPRNPMQGLGPTNLRFESCAPSYTPMAKKAIIAGIGCGVTGGPQRAVYCATASMVESSVGIAQDIRACSDRNDDTMRSFLNQ